MAKSDTAEVRMSRIDDVVPFAENGQRGVHLRRRKLDNLPDTGGRPASAEDAVLDPRQDLVGLLKTFFGVGGFDRSSVL